jgi:hypothetical protein
MAWRKRLASVLTVSTSLLRLAGLDDRSGNRNGPGDNEAHPWTPIPSAPVLIAAPPLLCLIPADIFGMCAPHLIDEEQPEPELPGLVRRVPSNMVREQSGEELAQ